MIRQSIPRIFQRRSNTYICQLCTSRNLATVVEPKSAADSILPVEPVQPESNKLEALRQKRHDKKKATLIRKKAQEKNARSIQSGKPIKSIDAQLDAILGEFGTAKRQPQTQEVSSTNKKPKPTKPKPTKPKITKPKTTKIKLLVRRRLSEQLAGSDKALDVSFMSKEPHLEPILPTENKDGDSLNIKSIGSEKNNTLRHVHGATTSGYELKPVPVTDLNDVPELSHNLDRVLFNPGVCYLQDPRSQVYNFDPYLQNLMSVKEFDFDALTDYVTSSKDKTLEKLSRELDRKYVGSTSSMTNVLGQFHFLLSAWREPSMASISRSFGDVWQSFTRLQKAPSSIILRWKDGVYAIDSDKEFDSQTILSMLGKSMEKLLTLPVETFEKYRKSNMEGLSEELKAQGETYHYTMFEDFLMRSQLDAKDLRLPGTGVFDLKTRAVAAIRHDVHSRDGTGYQIKTSSGSWESFEREYHDMIRAAFLKYSLQVRIGRMDGIFVAYHNTERIFGFQYISLSEMDNILHGSSVVAEMEFKHSLKLLNEVLDIATEKYPAQSLRIIFEARESTQLPWMYLTAEPIDEDEMKRNDEERILRAQKFLDDLINPDASVSVQGSHAEDVGNRSTIAAGEGIVSILRASQDIQTLNSGELRLDSTVTASSDSDTSTQAQSLQSTESASTTVSENFSSIKASISSERPTQDEKSTIIDAEAVEFSDLKSTSDVRESSLPVSTELDESYVWLTDSMRDCLPEEQDTIEQESPKNEKNFLFCELKIVNKVNGQTVVRPEELRETDSWTVDYTIAEVKKYHHKVRLYDQMRKRRQEEYDQERKQEQIDANGQSWYIANLKRISAQGRKWLEQQKKMNEGKDVVVYGQNRTSPATATINSDDVD